MEQSTLDSAVCEITLVLVWFVWVGRRTGRAGNHGYAYTFISQSQGKYAGEIIKALELSSAPVSDELKQLWEKYKQEAEAVMLSTLIATLNPRIPNLSIPAIFIIPESRD